MTEGTAAPTTALMQAESAFVDARGRAQGASDRTLRRRVGRLERRRDRDRLDVVGYARLKAYRFELAART